MASSVAPWASVRQRVAYDGVSFVSSMDTTSHDSDRCRALLLRLVREVLAFVRQQQQRTQSTNQRDGTSTLWMNAVSRVCEARLDQLQQSTEELLPAEERVKRTKASPREVIAEAMVQELLATVATIRLAETETTVMEEVENVETLRSLRSVLQREEAELRRVVKEGAGEDARLIELQRLLRDEFLQELAQSKALGLADSLHNEASLQFAWETIQEQKKEIVRLRAENEQLRSAGSAPNGNASYDDEPRLAIHQLQLQLSSHPDHNLRILQEQIAQLEATLGQHDRRGSRDPATSLSGMTMTSSRDDDDIRRDSMLLPSHLTTIAPRECEQCKRHTRALVECQSELKQRRAQYVADEHALVQAEKDHLHMKREHVALTSALVASKQKQEELRMMVLDISDDKLKIETRQETQQRNHERYVEQLQSQLKELESVRERSEQQREDHRNVQDALGADLRRVEQRAESLLTERDAALATVSKLKEETRELKDGWVVDKAKAVEAEHALASADGDLRTAKKELKTALDKIRQFEATTACLRAARDQAAASAEASASRLRDLEQQFQQERDEASDLRAALVAGESRVSKLQREVSKRDVTVRELTDQIADERSSREATGHQFQQTRRSLQQRQQYAAEVEGRLDRSEEERSLQTQRLEQALAAVQQHESQTLEAQQDLQQQYEECQRLEIQLSNAHAESTKSRNELQEATEVIRRLQESVDQQKQDREGVAASSQEQVESLTHELSETKTTILMWMSKYHRVVNEKAQVDEQLRLADAALNELRESYRVLAEDKEKVLVKIMADAQCHRADTQRLTKEIAILNVRVAEYDADSKRIKQTCERAEAEREACESTTAGQLVEIGVLQADRSILSREVASSQQRYRELETQLQDERARHAHELVGVKQAHQETLATAVLKLTSLQVAHTAVMDSAWQRVEGQLTGLDERIDNAAAVLASHDKVRLSELKSRVNYNAMLAPPSVSLPCANGSRRSDGTSKLVGGSVSAIVIASVSTQTTSHGEPHNDLNVGSTRASISAEAAARGSSRIDSQTCVEDLTSWCHEDLTPTSSSASVIGAVSKVHDDCSSISGLGTALSEQRAATADKGSDQASRMQSRAVALPPATRLVQASRHIALAPAIVLPDPRQLASPVPAGPDGIRSRDEHQQRRLEPTQHQQTQAELPHFEATPRSADSRMEAATLASQLALLPCASCFILREALKKHTNPSHEAIVLASVSTQTYPPYEPANQSRISSVDAAHAEDTTKDLDTGKPTGQQFSRNYREEREEPSNAVSSLDGRSDVQDSSTFYGDDLPFTIDELVDDAFDNAVSEEPTDYNAIVRAENHTNLSDENPNRAHNARTQALGSHSCELAPSTRGKLAQASHHRAPEPANATRSPRRPTSLTPFHGSDQSDSTRIGSRSEVGPRIMEPTHHQNVELEKPREHATIPQGVTSLSQPPAGRESIACTSALRHNANRPSSSSNISHGQPLAHPFDAAESSPTWQPILRRQALGGIVEHFTISEEHLATQWLRVEELVLQTSRRLDDVSNRAAHLVAERKRNRHACRSICPLALVSVGSQTSPVKNNLAATATRRSSTLDPMPVGRTAHVSKPADESAQIDFDTHAVGLLPSDPSTRPPYESTKRSAAHKTSKGVSTRLIQQSSKSKTSSTRRATSSITRLNQSSDTSSRGVVKSRLTARIPRSVVMLHVAPKVGTVGPSNMKSVDYFAVDIGSQTQNADSTCLTRTPISKWKVLTTLLLRRSAWRSIVTALKDNAARRQHRSTVAMRFVLLTLKLVAKYQSRGLLSIVCSQNVLLKAANARGGREIRVKRVLTRWESMVRSTMWRVSARKPLQRVVATLMKRADKRSSVQCQRRWQLFRWQLESRLSSQTAKQLWVKCVTLQRRTELERRLRRHFVAWHGLVRGLIHHPRLSQSDEDDEELKPTEAALRRPANVSTSLQLVMRECVTLLRQWCSEKQIPSDHNDDSYPSPQPSDSPSLAFSSVVDGRSSGGSTPEMNIELLIRLLLQSSEQIGQWREAMDKKLNEIRIREAQLTRLQTHCTELQAIIDKYHERHQQNQRQRTERYEISVSARYHQVHTHTHNTQHNPVHCRALEDERRRLNQRNIAMLEGVIVQLNEAKESRVVLYQQLQTTSKRLERTRWRLQQLRIHNVLLRAFYQWRYHTSRLRVNSPDHTAVYNND